MPAIDANVMENLEPGKADGNHELEAELHQTNEDIQTLISRNENIARQEAGRKRPKRSSVRQSPNIPTPTTLPTESQASDAGAAGW